MTTGAAKPRIVRCPACGGDSRYSAENPWRPFCSERCKNHDFGAWASEQYRVADAGDPAASGSSDDGSGEPAPPRH
ncbi:DNA gyrase inhibitor YacG [Piscinibacter sp.]|uniref:DNA gyrase inhibitor YacG n=1 Tax=Piscinibacter sp. TaxID=1903157 RepID=UPI0039E6F165